MSKKYVFPLSCVIMFILWHCAGTNQDGSNELTVTGVVVFPDSTRVQEATVRTEPPSSVVQTNVEGAFEIKFGLRPGDYEFVADYEEKEGRSTARIQYGDNMEIFIMIGKKIDLRQLEANKIRMSTKGSGIKRTEQ